MKLTKKREHLSMDLTPLIDVVFLLLIFFIVASEFKKENSALNLILPKSGQPTVQIEKKEVLIEVTNEKISFKGEVVTVEEFQDLVSKEKPENNINLKIDEKVLYKRVIKVMDILKANNLNNLMLITEREK
ncbi:MAG: biopolymer transporter ExbD [Campylobacterales bacterium]|nr:biopolymer transporter ExbD [Campylobacterales bacterium]